MGIKADLQSLQPGAMIELFELDATALGGDLLRFHNGLNQLNQPLVWQGNTYTPFPVEATGFEYSGKGTLPRPVLRVANVTGLLGALVRSMDDLLGAKVTRKRTLAKYLDAINFNGSVNPTADPTAALPDEVYFVDQKTSENKVLVEFALAASFDCAGVMIPLRTVQQGTCPWQYRVLDEASGCSWTGTTYYDATDAPVATAAQDVCGRRLSSCKKRFGNNPLPFGGFPGVGLTR